VNAIADALGVEPREIPVTPERLYAMRNAEWGMRSATE
jgi:hypothetical protein